jgi:hypothetical protein
VQWVSDRRDMSLGPLQPPHPSRLTWPGGASAESSGAVLAVVSDVMISGRLTYVLPAGMGMPPAGSAFSFTYGIGGYAPAELVLP